jgi:hypothetical protein
MHDEAVAQKLLLLLLALPEQRLATSDLQVHVLVTMSDTKVMPEEDGEKVEPFPVPCDNCDADCWKVGWLLLAEEGEDRKNLCDNCFLFTPKPKGAERRYQGSIRPNVPKKEKKKVIKKKPAAAPKAVKKKPAAVKRTRK